jgi:iron transport multicopper oxidase
MVRMHEAGARHGRRAPAREIVAAIILALALLAAQHTAVASGAGITNSGGDLRDGWYPNQPRLAPDAVSSSTFGQLWDAPVDGQVYAQPLVNGTSVVVATERNKIYSFDSETGHELWSRDLDPPYPADLIGCGDLYPDLGVTATPVIDTATNTIYLTHKTFASGTSGPAAYYLDALDGATGLPRAGFPRKIEGSAQNASGIAFDATKELQRPGLLLLDGVVYLGFGGHCDFAPYQGWVFGVRASTGAITARWSAVTQGDGAGIWQSGSGLMSDGPGRLFVSTGNGGSPKGPSDTPSGMFGESIVRLDVQSDGTLKAGDFFAPADAAHLDDYDADFASGGVTALRDDVFGTSTFPHVGVAVGKAGYVYLLNRDDLGGIGMGAGHGDDVISRVGPYGGVWSRPGVWPGDGGWIAIPTASPSAGENPDPTGSSGYLKLYRYRKAANGTPSLDAPIQSDDAFGFSSGAPVITSDGTTSGSAVLWIVWAPNGWAEGGQLRAYDAVPKNGHLNLRRSFPIGQSSKFSMPGVGDGRLYVGARNGHVLAFGAPVKATIQAPATTFPLTTTGQKSTQSVKLTASEAVTITAVTASPSQFVARPSGLPKTLAAGGTFTVPVDFTPTDPGAVGGSIAVTTNKGPFTFTLNGSGAAPAAVLTASPPIVSFGGAVVGDSQASVVTFGNGGGQPLTVTGVELPGAPFAVESAPAVNSVIGPNEAVNVVVHYAPTAVGDYNDDLVLHTTAGDKTVGLSGSAGLGPKLALSPADGWQFGAVTVGASATKTVTVSNTGDSPMTITKSKPPTTAAFGVVDSLDEATVIPAGGSRMLSVTFTPTAAGTVTDAWTINAGDGTGVHLVALSGRGIAPGHLTGPASASVGDVVLGDTASTTVTFGNDGGLPLTVSGFDQPDVPWTVSDAPAIGSTIAAGGALTVHVSLASLAPGPASGTLTLHTSAGDRTIALAANVVTSGTLELAPADRWDFGAVTLGTASTLGLTLRNGGTGPLKVLASTPPGDPRFAVVDAIPVGLTLAPGEARTFRVAYTPSGDAETNAYWSLATTAETGVRMIPLLGHGTPPVLQPQPLPLPPVVPPPPVTPPVGGQGPVVPAAPKQAKAGLTISAPRLSRDGRALAVRGFIARAATGALRVTLKAKVGRTTIALPARAVRLTGKPTYALTLKLTRTTLKWARLEVHVAYPGSARVAPGTGAYVLVRAAGR